MQLNPEGQARFRQHLQTVIRKPCAICDSGNWHFDDRIFELRQFAGGGLSTQGAIMPVVTLTCESCGNVVFLNALKAGIVRVEQNAAEVSTSVESEVAEEETGI